MGQSVRGIRIKRLREERQLTQGQLASYAGVTQSYISYVEREQAVNMGTDALVPIARVLETSLDYLTGLTDDPRASNRPAVGQLSKEEEQLIRDFRAIKTKEVREYILFSARSAVEKGI